MSAESPLGGRRATDRPGPRPDRRVLDRESPRAVAVQRAAPLYPLTPTELRIADHLAIENASLRQLAHQQGCSRSTMKNHIERIAMKLPGTLPAKLRVTCWARGALLAALYIPPPLPSTPSGPPLPGPMFGRSAGPQTLVARDPCLPAPRSP